MPYIGKSPQHGNYSKLDDISSGFDGSDATHALASNSIAITPVRPEALLISINGVIQEPVTDYTVSGTNITFTTAPISTDSFFGVAMGEQLAIGTPSDATITSAKLSGNLTTPGTLTVTDSALISGSTPTLTIGDAGAEDTKIVFDGNAQDFHIGLDDTADDLVIGLGSTLGTTTHMSFDEAGIVSKPLQPSFGAYRSTSGNTIATGATTKIAFNGERHDVNADFDTTNNRFVAPVDGRYLITVGVMLTGIGTTNGGRISLNLYVDNSAVVEVGRYTAGTGEGFGTSFVEFSLTGSSILDLDASEYVEAFIYNNSGATVTANFGSGSTDFTYMTGEKLS